MLGLPEFCDFGLLPAVERTSESDPPTISINCRTFNKNNKLGRESRSVGYKVCVVSIASPIRPLNTRRWIPFEKVKKIVGHEKKRLYYLTELSLRCLFFIEATSSPNS